MRTKQLSVRAALGKAIFHIAVGLLAVLSLTLLCYRTHVDLATAIPLYLLLIVVQSLTGDFRSTAVISILATACLDFFFTEPLFSVRMTNPLNALALTAFLLTALVITRLVSRVREEAKSSRLQKDRLDRLYQVSQQLLALAPEQAMTEDFLEPFRRLFGVAAVCVFDSETAETHIVGDSRQQLEDQTREAYIRGQDVERPDICLSVRCLRVGGKTQGAIGFEGLRDIEESAGPLTALTAALLERNNAFRQAGIAAAAAQTEVYRSAVLDALAHEFKTPLATILAAAGGIREAGPLGADQMEMTDTVESEAARLGKLTSRLLRTARLDSEEIRPRMEIVDVTSMLARAARQSSQRSMDRHISWTDGQQHVEVLADPELLRLAVNQLIENACKYSRPGSTVKLDIVPGEDFVSVRVSNSGSTIPYGEQRRVFERFYRGAEARRATSGSGLGLYVARKIAVAHGGALDLEMEQSGEAGVAFCLKVPNTKGELDHAATKL